ncbi:hypothetical protein HYS90_00315 [Candidatus Curtissbacteria bacterium]|nr:hypothetical protein [Candidatus Curtissbacteria bacterium]
MATTISKNGVLIRLTEERWKHIVLLHPNLSDKQTEVLLTVKNPDYIFKGQTEELLAVSKLSARVYIVVAYKETLFFSLRSKKREIKSDGFIITAYDTTDVQWLFKKELIWSKDS